MAEINHKLIRDDLTGRSPKLATGVKPTLMASCPAYSANITARHPLTSRPAVPAVARPILQHGPAWRHRVALALQRAGPVTPAFPDTLRRSESVRGWRSSKNWPGHSVLARGGCAAADEDSGWRMEDGKPGFLRAQSWRLASTMTAQVRVAGRRVSWLAFGTVGLFRLADILHGLAGIVALAGLLVQRFRAEFVLDAQAIGHKVRN